MNRFAICAALAALSIGSAHAAPCFTASLSTYLNGGTSFACTEPSGTVAFNHDILPSYVGLNLLSGNNGSANPANITVTPGTNGLLFESAQFSESSALLSSQAELVHFLFTANTSILGTTFFLEDPLTSVGGFPGLGTGLAIGQELVCVGGTFTSLPVGLVTSVANGLLGVGQFGCTGVGYIGTVASSSGPLNAITSVLGLPDLAGVTAQAQILFGVPNQTIDVIKIQALLAVLGGTASTSGFGNTFAVAAVPEPSSAGLSLLGGSAIWLSILVQRRKKRK